MTSFSKSNHCRHTHPHPENVWELHWCVSSSGNDGPGRARNPEGFYLWHVLDVFLICPLAPPAHSSKTPSSPDLAAKTLSALQSALYLASGEIFSRHEAAYSCYSPAWKKLSTAAREHWRRALPPPLSPSSLLWVPISLLWSSHLRALTLLVGSSPCQSW